MDQPIASFSQFSVVANEAGSEPPVRIDDSATLHFRAVHWVAISSASRLGTATLAVRQVRIVGRRSAVVVAWGAAGGYPSYPREDMDSADEYARGLSGIVVGPDMANTSTATR